MKRSTVPASSAIHRIAPGATKEAPKGGGRGIARFGISRLRLQGATEIGEAAQKLQLWEADLQTQESSLEHYTAVVVQRERAMLLAEAETLRQRQELQEQKSSLEQQQQDWRTVEDEVRALASFQRDQTARVREQQGQAETRSAALAERARKLAADEAVMARKQTIGSELLEAMRAREEQCRVQESKIHEQAGALAQKQTALADWQVQVERLAGSLAQQHAHQQAGSAVAAHDAPNESVANARQAALGRRLEQLEQLERQLDQREKSVLARAAQVQEAAFQRTRERPKVAAADVIAPGTAVSGSPMLSQRDTSAVSEIARLQALLTEAQDRSQGVASLELHAAASKREEAAVAAEADCNAARRLAEVATEEAAAERERLVVERAEQQAAYGQSRCVAVTYVTLVRRGLNRAVCSGRAKGDCGQCRGAGGDRAALDRIRIPIARARSGNNKQRARIGAAGAPAARRRS